VLNSCLWVGWLTSSFGLLPVPRNLLQGRPKMRSLLRLKGSTEELSPLTTIKTPLTSFAGDARASIRTHSR